MSKYQSDSEVAATFERTDEPCQCPDQQAHMQYGECRNISPRYKVTERSGPVRGLKVGLVLCLACYNHLVVQQGKPPHEQGN